MVGGKAKTHRSPLATIFVIKSIKLETAASRAVLIAGGFFCLTAAIFFAKWCFANVIAVHAPNLDVAELSVALAPSDPQTHYAVAVLNEKTFLAEDSTKALAEFGKAVALAPHDFRLWLAYGKALERNGEAEKAESALRKALQFAPNYAAVQWTLGNLLLRRGKTEEGFGEIRRAAENDAAYRLPAMAIAWQIFDGEAGAVKKMIGDSANLNSALAVFLAGHKRLDDAAEIWSALPAAGKAGVYKADGEQIFGALLGAKKYRKALQLQNDFTAAPDGEKFAVGKIYNGGFEEDLTREKADAFDWRVADGAQPQIGPNTEEKSGGTRSIFIIFNSKDGKDFRQISQVVAVESAQKYVFSGFYKSDIKTVAALNWEIADAADGKVLAATAPLTATADWTNFAVSFAAPENAEAVVVRLARQSCRSIICPIAGNVWFDDFSISR